MSKLRDKGRRVIGNFRELPRTAETVVKKTAENPFMKEFREFAIKGNIVELSIGILIGGGFNKIVMSFVNDIIMPPISLVIGKVNFADLFINLSGTRYKTLEEATAAGAPTLNYGLFISTIIDFTILALIVFLAVRQIQRIRNRLSHTQDSSVAQNAS